ncbi:MAG: SDR family NAD(P)-dependent oxidoreductase [Bacteroidales bacterium]
MNFCNRNFAGKTFLIIGATSGIAKAIVNYLATTGAHLILTGRNKDLLARVSQSLAVDDTETFSCDITMETDIDSLVAHLNSLDGLVFCSGINKRLPLKMLKSNAIEEIFKVNVYGFILLVSKLYKHGKLNNGSSVVAISSVASRYASLGNILYMSTKGALESAIRGMALELAKNKIRINAVRPGMIYTAMSTALTEDIVQKDLVKYPLQRYGLPEDVAYAVAYLLSEESSWITGSFITMDGGLTLNAE